MAGVSRLPDASEQLTARCAELVDGAGCETAEVHPYRSPAEAPLRKLTVDLIKTYRKINEVSETPPLPVEVSSSTLWLRECLSLLECVSETVWSW